MSQISLYPYELKVSQQQVTRKGYLLKVESAEFNQGFADIFPWTQFGDPSFEAIPSLLKQGKSTPLLSRSLQLARKDGMARTKNMSLFSGKSLRNHFLLSSLENYKEVNWNHVFDQGFKRIKIKIQEVNDPEIILLRELVSQLPADVLLRLDMNGQGSLEALSRLEEFKSVIEFIEDPSENPELWSDQFPMALDQALLEPSLVKAPWQIIKPAKQDYKKRSSGRVVFTSYMDHPVGIAHAFAEALDFGKQRDDYGLMSQNIYEATPFHQAFVVEGARLSFKDDIGIGFTSLLEGLKWEALL